MSRRVFVVSLLSAALVACGGSGGTSGGGGSPKTLPTATAAQGLATTPVTVDASNDQKVASVGAGAGTAASGLGLSGRSLEGKPTLPNRLIAQLQQYAHASKFSGLRVVQRFSEDCLISGTISGSLNDVNGNGISDAGDTASLTFNQCVDKFNGAKTNGSMGLVFNACTPSFSGGSCEASKLTLDFTVSDVNGGGSIKGDMSMLTQEDISLLMGSDHLTSTALSFTFGNESVGFYNLVSDSSWDYGLGTSSDAADFTLDLNVTGFVGRLVVDSTAPMMTNNFNFYPDTGSTTITGSAGTTVVLDANTGDLNTVQVTTNGGIPQLFTWFELEQQSPIPSFF